MLITVSANTDVDLKSAILANTGNAVAEGDVVVVEWAESPNASSKVFLVSSVDGIETFDAYDGVLISGDPTSVNFVRGVKVTADNIYLSNKSKFTCNFLVYTN